MTLTYYCSVLDFLSTSLSYRNSYRLYNSPSSENWNERAKESHVVKHSKMVKIKPKISKKKVIGALQTKKEDDNVVTLPPVRMSDDPPPKQVRMSYLQSYIFFNYC